MAKFKPYRYPLYLIFRGAACAVYLLPRPAALWLGRAIGRLSYFLVGRQRKNAVQSLTTAFGSVKSAAEIRRLAVRVFEHQGQTAAEVLQFPKLTPEKAARIADAGQAVRVYEELLKEGHGLISVTAHLGNWELLAGIFSLRGFRGAVLGRRIYYEPYNRWIVGLRRSLGLETIYRDESARRILEILKRNEIIGLLPDQDIPSLKGLFVDFLGRPAYTSVAPVRLAMASGAPILPNFLVRLPGGKYRLVVKDPIRAVETRDSDRGVRRYTEEWMRVFEDVIREYPDQWAWMHNRWKTRPDAAETGKQEAQVSSC